MSSGGGSWVTEPVVRWEEGEEERKGAVRHTHSDDSHESTMTTIKRTTEGCDTRGGGNRSQNN